jgi:hypothetical protein
MFPQLVLMLKLEKNHAFHISCSPVCFYQAFGNHLILYLQR